jgi:hypothetical protein
LIVENDGPVLKCISSEESLKEQKRRAQQQRGQNRKNGEQRQLNFQDVPEDRCVPE